MNKFIAHRKDTIMKRTHTRNLIAAALVCALAFTATIARAAESLPSWNDGPAKKAIVEFVAKVTKEGTSDFVPPAERIATFDNDGTLWCEQPVPVQLFFALDRVKALAPQHPEWKDKEPFASLLKGDLKGALAGGEKNTNWESGYRVPTAIRWPGVIKPGTVLNDVVAHEDMIPTLLAAAGVPDVKEQLLKRA